MKTNEDVKANKKVKDSLFRFLFGENKENAISLYNAVNNTAYTAGDGFEYTTLEDVVYMKMKNDVSFVLGVNLNLYEHQSTYNPNMPLRGLLYFADLYRQMIKDSEKLYGKKLIKIPMPQYIVFYNGSENDMEEERIELRLSDAFETEEHTGGYEWTAVMININSGHNQVLMEKCRVLKEYALFIEKIKTYGRTNDFKTAVDKAVAEAINEDILKEFLEKHRREVFNMTLTEFDEAKYEKIIREESREEGREEIIRNCLKNGKTCEEIADFNGIPLEEVKAVEDKYLQLLK
ncbi:MAG: hypothetical protein PUA75_07520 [Clostridiales bacterium]|nr:hypothetical protein [Clostridiales bacterium]